MSKVLPDGLSPKTFALHGGYDPARSEGAVKPPLFATSTFAAATSAELAGWFRQAYGLDDGHPKMPDGLIYSRLVNPDLQIFEERWSKFEGTEQSALCASGMAAIVTTILTFCRPGDRVLYSVPVYGGTDYFMEHVLPSFDIRTQAFPVDTSGQDVADLVRACERVGGTVKIVYLESPANPTLLIADVEGVARALRDCSPKPSLVVDNTVLGPMFYQPIALGADLVVHSATKSIGGHSDLIAGIACGSADLIATMKATRTIFGTMADPHTAWLLLRSLETYPVRVEAAEQKALKVARFLQEHSAVEELFFPGFSQDADQQSRFQTHCLGHGSLMSFTVRGSREAAYHVLDRLRVVRLAVSLGSTESLAEHPRTHTHSDIAPADLDRFGVSEGMIRLSVGLEDADDVIADLAQAFEELS